MDTEEDCEICGGETEIEFFNKRRELICLDCGSILDSDEFGENMEPREDNVEVME